MATNFIDILTERATARPGQLAVIENLRGKWVPIGVAELNRQIGQAAALLAGAGVTSESTVLNAISGGLPWVLVDLGSQSIGARAVAPQRTDDDSVVALTATTGASFVVVGDELVAARLEARVAPQATVVVLERSADAPSASLQGSSSAQIVFVGDDCDPVARPVADVVADVQQHAQSTSMVADDVAVVGGPCGEPGTRMLTVYACLAAGSVLAFPERITAGASAAREVQPTVGYLPADLVRSIGADLDDRVSRTSGVKRLLVRPWSQGRGGLSSALVARPARRLVGLSRARAMVGDASAMDGSVDRLGAAITAVLVSPADGTVLAHRRNGAYEAVPGVTLDVSSDAIVCHLANGGTVRISLSGGDASASSTAAAAS